MGSTLSMKTCSATACAHHQQSCARMLMMKKDVDVLSIGQINDEPEICLICGEFTPYTKGTHVDFRVGYIRGAGQGCFSPDKCSKNK